MLGITPASFWMGWWRGVVFWFKNQMEEAKSNYDREKINKTTFPSLIPVLVSLF